MPILSGLSQLVSSTAEYAFKVISGFQSMHVAFVVTLMRKKSPKRLSVLLLEACGIGVSEALLQPGLHSAT